MKQIIIGLGEVGQALHKIFPDAEAYDWQQAPVKVDEPYGVMHICFPYSEHFHKEVEQYQAYYQPDITVIHSSVPIGTSDELGAVHSPVRGVHPNLEQGIRTFVKYFGGARAEDAAIWFHRLGIECIITKSARTTEALKLWDTTQYGVMIMLEKEIFKFCEQQGLDFDLIYRHANRTYNDGYTKLGMSSVVRPQLVHKEGKIGGHCVIENAHLLDTPTAKRIIEENSTL